MTDTTQSTEWLKWLYGPEPLGLIWIGGHGDGFAGRTFTNISDAVQYAAHLDTDAAGGVYHRLTTLRAGIEKGRGTAADSAYLPGFAMDLDLKGPGHKALNNPETEQDLATLLTKAGLPEPSAWVHSGGGRYPFWKLAEPADLTIPGALEQAATASAALHRLTIEWAAELGWKVDNTSDLARVYRLPGTMNRKVPDAPVVCEVQIKSTRTYGVISLSAIVEQAPRPVPADQDDRFEGAPFGGASSTQLFSSPWVSPYEQANRYTLEQALTRVQPKLTELAEAKDGEINNRLLAAALTLAHFGEQFWTREQAEKRLFEALDTTVYDGRTWKAGDTIRRAYEDMASKVGDDYWRAVFVPTVEQAPPATGRLRRAMLKRSEVHGLPDPVPLIEGVLYRNSVVVLAGKFGTYKSFIAVSWAASLATGVPWFGNAVPARVPVIYAAAEGAYGIRRRLDAWEARYGAIPDDLYLIPVSVRINRPEDMRELEEIIVETGAAALIFDTLHASTPGADENDAGEMGDVFDVLRTLQEKYGICSILPHHTGHSGERARGTSSIEDDADITFVIKLGGDGEDRRPENPRTLYHRKAKDEATQSPAELTLVLVDGTKSGYVTTSDAYQRAAGEVPIVVDHGQVQEVGEVSAWVRTLTAPGAEIQQRILQVLLDVAGGAGRTEAQVRKLVASRWHEGKTGRGRGALNVQAFDKAWTKVLALESGQVGRTVIAGELGEKSMIINPEIMSE